MKRHGENGGRLHTNGRGVQQLLSSGAQEEPCLLTPQQRTRPLAPGHKKFPWLTPLRLWDFITPVLANKYSR